MKTEGERVQKSIKSHPKWNPGALWGLLGRQSFPGTPKVSARDAFWEPLGTNGFWRRHQSCASSKKLNIKWERWGPRKGFEQMRFFDVFLVPKGEALRCKEEVLPCYMVSFLQVLVVTSMYGKWRSRWYQEEIKIEALGVQGSIFSDSVRFYKHMFVDDCLKQKKFVRHPSATSCK